MSGISSIVEYGCLSDEQRWKANNYNWQWLHELDDHDKKIVELLDCLAEGEFSGQASAAQMYDLIFQEKKSGMQKEYVYDWGEILSYINIIVYEETRHGISLGLMNHFAKSGKLDFIQNLSVREYSEKYVWCYDERTFWDLYSYALSHLFGEVINTELYRDLRSLVHHEELRNVITNIMKDEARHTRAWSSLIKNVIEADNYHKQRFLKSVDVGLTYHNAMVHNTYFEGQNKMMHLFVNPQEGQKGAIDRIVDVKFHLMQNLFGNDNPYTKEEIKEMHVDFLMKSLGKSSAVYAPGEEGNISFVD